MLDFYGTPVSQCEIAEYARSVITWRNFGTDNCCDNPSGLCNYWNYNWEYAGSIQDILEHFAEITSIGVVRSLSTSEVQIELENQRPFIIRWGWTLGGGYFIVGHGLVDGTLYYMDPWFGEELKFADYS